MTSLPDHTDAPVTAREYPRIVQHSLPPEGFFLTWEALYASVKAHAKLAHYTLVIGRGSGRVAHKGNRWIRFLCCSHGGKLDKRSPKEEDRVRERATRKTDCKVKLKAIERPDGVWELKHMEGRYIHNHQPFDPVSYLQSRKLDDQQIAQVITGQAAGISTSRTKASLVAADSVLDVTNRDLSNTKAAINNH